MSESQVWIAHGLAALDEQQLVKEEEGLGARLVDGASESASAVGETTE